MGQCLIPTRGRVPSGSQSAACLKSAFSLNSAKGRSVIKLTQHSFHIYKQQFHLQHCYILLPQSPHCPISFQTKNNITILETRQISCRIAQLRDAPFIMNCCLQNISTFSTCCSKLLYMKHLGSCHRQVSIFFYSFLFAVSYVTIREKHSPFFC